MWIWLIMAGCEQPVQDLQPPGAPPVERALSIDSDLTSAHEAWLDQDSPKAQSLATRAYATHFEPMEALLRDHDPLRTLELEYRFGQLMHAVARDDSAGEVTFAVGILRDGVAEIVGEVAPKSTGASTSSAPEQADQGQKTQE